MSTRIGLIGVLILIGIDLYTKVVPHSLWDAWGLTGLVLVVLGICLRSWSAGLLHKREILTTTGPYTLVRHPLYIGSLLIALGFSTILGKVDTFVLIGVLMFFHIRKARREERQLRELFGSAWDAYVQRVGAFYPKTFPAGIFQPWSLKQWWKNTEYGAFFTGISGLVVMALWYQYSDVVSQLVSRLHK
jgi:protein-S-isoprenylcysteine O-methyltransferase Ste14